MKKIYTFGASILASFAAGAIGSLATLPNIPTWYAQLEKPLLTPPNWIFGPVWSTLYLLMGIALALVILQTTDTSKKKAFGWFSAQLIFNALWSIVFFGLHAPWLGVIVIILLIVSLLMTIIAFKKIKPLAAWLLIPYLVWVCFATYLTVSIAVLNQ
ncbi:MAG TPA: TspO/MBR family protein [Candidatus Saccharimonadales bacterium]|nr:TspO/MBR family protein [Candidatus Saccharimonadales bacterium]